MITIIITSIKNVIIIVINCRISYLHEKKLICYKHIMNNLIKIISFLFLMIVSNNLKAETYEENVQKEISIIESYYWFGLEEKGNFKIFSDGLKKIQILKKAGEFKTLNKNLRLKIEALETDFNNQIDMAFDTFYGVFPLARFLDNNILKDASSFGTYEIIDDFEVIASTSAISNLITTLAEKERKQMDVVFISNPPNVPCKMKLYTCLTKVLNFLFIMIKK